MGKPVRLRTFDEDGVNTALQQLSDQIRGYEPKAVTGLDLYALEMLRNYIDDVAARLKGFVPVTRRVNGMELSEDVTFGSDDIPFSDTDRSVTDRMNEMLVPVNIRGSVRYFHDLPASGNQAQDAWVVTNDANNNGAAWLYVWQNRGPGFAWYAIAPFGVDLSNFYTRDETWSAIEIIRDQLRQDRNVTALIETATNSILIRAETMVDIRINSNNVVINQGIANARGQAMDHADGLAARLRGELVPNTRRVNGIPLLNDAVLSSLNIPHENTTVGAALNALGSAINLTMIVDRYEELPPVAGETTTRH